MVKTNNISGFSGVKGFSLVELMIVVAVLGILAAIALPEFSGHTQKAKESAAKDNLRLFREAVGRYAAQHGMSPGYYNTSQITPTFLFYAQLTKFTNTKGMASATKSQTYPYSPYLSKFPVNPFNNKDTVQILANGVSFPSSATGSYGWMYQPQTKTVRLDWPGIDSQGIKYYDY